MGNLKRTLNLAEVVFFASGVILGAGIYTVIGKAAGAGGNMLWLSFSIAALTALLSLFAYAELVSMFPKAGGEFVFVQEAAGINWAFVVGVMVSLSGIISAATISLGFAGYFTELTDFPMRSTALLIIAVIFLVNVTGIRHSSWINIIFTLIETGGLLFVIVSAAPSAGQVNYTELPPEGFTGIMTGAAICFFAFTGFEDAVKLAEETKDPTRNIPRGLFLSGAVVVSLYLTLSILVISMIPFEQLSGSDSPLSTVVEKRFGRTGAIVIAVIALFSTANSLLSNMLGSSRVIYNMGRESKRLKVFSTVLPGRKTPGAALLLAAVLAAGISLLGNIRTAALATNFFMFITFFFMNVIVIYLRVKQQDTKRPFRIPINVGNIPVISVLAAMLTLVLMAFTVYGLAQGYGAGGH